MAATAPIAPITTIEILKDLSFIGHHLLSPRAWRGAAVLPIKY